MSRGPAPEVDERIADWVDDRLSPRDRARFEAELRVNARLRAEADRYRRTVTALRSALAGGEDVADLTDRVLAAVQRPTAPRAPIRVARASRPALIASGLVAAAALVLLFSLSRWEPAASRGAAVAQREPQEGTKDAVVVPPEAAAGRPASAALARSAKEKTDAPAAPGAPAAGAAGLSADVGASERKAVLDPAAETERAKQLAVPATMVARITLLPLTVPATGGGGGGGGRGAEGASPRPGALDLAALAGDLVPRKLTGVPPGTQGADDAAPEQDVAWLLEGKPSEIEAFLGRLGAAARERGLELRAGEADAAAVAALVPAAPVTPSYVEGEPERRSPKPAGPAEPGARMKLVVVLRTGPERR